MLLAVSGVFLALGARGLIEWPAAVEWHRTRLLPLVAAIQQPITGASVTTIGEPLVVIGVLAAALRLYRTRSRALPELVLAAGGVTFAFYLSWGAAYRFGPLENRLVALRPGDATAEAARLQDLALKATRLVNRFAAEAPSAPEHEAFLARTNAALSTGFDALPASIEASPLRGVTFGSVRVSRVSWALSRLQLSGYYFPWTGESQINGEMPLSLWPRVAAHEKAHQRGFARENEATVIGLLGCLASPDPYARYSGALGIYAAFDRELARSDPASRAALWDELSELAKRDLRDEVAFWKRFDGPAAVVSEKVNDRYLKTQGVRSGVASYGETTRLLLAAMATPGLPLAAALEAEDRR